VKQIVSASELGLLPASRLLVVMPHPDDETEFCGGFLSKAALENIHITLLCMSNGEASTLRYGLNPHEQLGVIREFELRNAAKVLGIQDVQITGFPDSKLSVFGESMRSFVSHYINKIKPAMVITLEPNGIYGHPDHIAVTKAVENALSKSSKKPKLAYITVGKNYSPNPGAKKMVGKNINVFEANYLFRLHTISSQKKIEALKAHKSQFVIDESFFNALNQMEMLDKEFLVF
jgi:N-acetylglucosamine malate deacetylase 2